MQVEDHGSDHQGSGCFDLVAVHGLYSSIEKAWERQTDGLPSWPKAQVDNQKLKGRVLLHDYEKSATLDALRTREGVQAEAVRLLEQVLEHRKGQDPPLPLMFVAADFGGVIVKEALIQATRHGNLYASIKASTRFLIFCGTPHRWRSMQELQTKIVHFALPKAGDAFRSDDAAEFARTLAAVSDSFLQTGMLIRANVLNVFSKDGEPSSVSPAPSKIHGMAQDDQQGGKHKLSEPFNATFSIPMEMHYQVKSKTVTLSDTAVRDGIFQELKPGITRVTEFPWLDDSFSPLIDVLESQATSVYPLKTHFHDGHTFKWLDKQIAFSKWVDRHQSNLIHIHGTSMVSEAAEYAFHKLSADPESPGEEVILYFKFDRHDQRRNSIRAMAITFLAQILGRFRNSPSTFITELESPLFGQTLTEKDAFFLLNSVRIELVSKTRVSWILDGLDECDPVSSQWFLSEILGILERSEMYLKVLVTTVDDKRIRDTLAKHPQIDMKNHIGDQLEHPIAPRTFAHQLYLELLAQRPEIQPCYAEIENLFRGCWTDRELSSMIFEWLLATRDSITKRFVKKVVAALSPPSPQKTLGWMLGSVSEEDRPWIRKLMLWVLHSAKPLNPDELTSALFLSSDASDNELDDWMPLDFMPEISRSFKWLFVIENNEVRFKHPATAKYLTTDTADEKRKAPWYEFATPGAGHQEITQTCVKFLRNTAIMNGIKTACGAPRDSRLVLDRVEDFQSYAIQFWPYHFKLALKEDQQADLQGDIAQFLQDSDALGCWFQANRHFTAPHLQASSSSIHLLPIFSYLGLKKQVQELVAGLTDSEEKDELMACALIEAARVGNKGIVDDLLRDPGTISLGPVMDAMEAASISGEFSTLADLLSYTVAKHEMSSYRWPHILLCRLAWAGEDGLLEDYLKLEVSAGSPDNDHGDVPSELYCACTRNQTGAIRVLLERRSDTKLHDPKRKNRTALHVAAKYGQVAAIKALVSAGATVDAEDDYERPAVYWAAILAQQEALGALLDAGADPKFFETMTPKPDGWPGIITVAIPAYEKCLRLLLDHDVDVNCVRPKDGSTAISRAAYNKLLDICRLLLERGANVDGSERSRTLVLAASTGSVELVRLLLDHGADINTKQENSHWKGTSLMAAAERNFKDVVKFLLEKEAEINVTVDGEDALWRAASRGSGDAASLLLAAGAERNRKSGTGSWSPLHVAYSDPECLKVLLEAGLDTEVTSVDSTALYLASFHGQTESVRLFIKHGANVEVSCVFPGLTDSEFTPLLAAAMNGHAPIVRALLEAGANPRATAPDKQTALHLAIGSKSIPTVMALLEYNPDLDAKTDGGSAVLHLPNSKTSPDLVRPIVNRGADIEIRNKNGYTPLNRAVLQQNTELVKFFIAAKANVNVVDSYWGGPLHVAVTRQNLDLVKLLLESGADVNLMDPVYGTPLANVCIVDTTDKETKHKIIRYLLQDAGADINACGGILGTALHAACLRDGVDIIKSLLVSGADVNCPDVFDRRPIHHATFRTVDHMSLLLSSGADIHARDKLGRTALHTAVASGRVDVVQKVLSLTNGLINEPDVDGWTPLLWATRPCREWGGITSNQAEILKLLISRGANLWVKGKGVDQEWSALKLAKYHSASPEIIALLTPDIKKRVKEDGDEETWDPQLHRSRKARSQNGYCDACLYSSYGLVYEGSRYAMPAWVCLKCCMRKEEFFPGCTWKQSGEEFEEGDEEESEAAAEEQVASPSAPETSFVKQVDADDEDEEEWSDDEAPKPIEGSTEQP